MGLQLIQDGSGKTTGVFIPIEQWKQLKKQHSNLEFLEYTEPTKAQILQELKQAVVELSLVEKGKQKSKSCKRVVE